MRTLYYVGCLTLLSLSLIEKSQVQACSSGADCPAGECCCFDPWLFKWYCGPYIDNSHCECN